MENSKEINQRLFFSTDDEGQDAVCHHRGTKTLYTDGEILII